MGSKTPEKEFVDDAVCSYVNAHESFVQSVSPSMQAIERVVADVAPTAIPVLIVGESGTGKESVALLIHRLSGRGNEPFIKMNCSALTPEFLSRRPAAAGKGERAGCLPSSGTVLLDDVSDLDLGCQARLLHLLSDGVWRENQPGARVISATSRNLEEQLRIGNFREELYYRINGVCLRLPQLRNRKEDIPALVDFFLTKYTAVFGRPRPTLSPQTLSRLLDHSWPGNIRELQNTVKKMITLGDEGVAVADLVASQADPQPSDAIATRLSLKEAARAASRRAERELILKVLARTRWNRKRAAQELQISYKALLYKLKQIGLVDPAEG